MDNQIMIIFVPYQLSDIQKGIQAGHCALEYSNSYGNTDEYKQFIENDKTWIVLNGGTTNNSAENPGDIQNILNNIKSWNALNKDVEDEIINFETFSEPDLNNALTGVCFLIPLWLWENRSNDYINYEDAPDSKYLEKSFLIKNIICNAEFA